MGVRNYLKLKEYTLVIRNGIQLFAHEHFCKPLKIKGKLFTLC